MKTNETYKKDISTLIDQFFTGGKKGTILITMDTVIRKVGVQVDNPSKEFKVG